MTTITKIIEKHLKSTLGPTVSLQVSGTNHIAIFIQDIITTQSTHDRSQNTVSLWLYDAEEFGKSPHKPREPFASSTEWYPKFYNVNDPELLTKLTCEIQHHHDKFSKSNMRTPKNAPPTPTINA